MKKLFIALAAITASSAFAADIDGAYVELQAGSANSSGYNSGIANSGAMRIDGGVKINPYMSVEAGFNGLTRPTTQTNQRTNSALQFYDASFKGTLPLGDMFNIHAQLGAAYATGSTANASTNATIKLLAGAGVDFNLTKNLAIVVNDYGYLNPNLDSNSILGGNTNVVMGGIKYNF